MNNDPKMPFNNVDAELRSFSAQARSIAIGHEESNVMKMMSVLDKGEVSAFEQCLSRNGLIQTIEIRDLPPGFDNARSTVSIKDQMQAFRSEREKEAPSMKRFLSSLFKKDPESTLSEPGL